MKTCNRYHRRNGFTLIELLVVIAIISLLVSILLPSLQQAKALARQVICLTRLKSISSTLSIYQAEFDGRGPVGMTSGGSAWGGRRRGIFAEYEKYPNPYFVDDAIEDTIGWFTKKQDRNKFTPQYGGGLCWGLGEYLNRKGTCVRDDGGPTESPVACPCGNDSSMGGTQAEYAINYFLGYDTFLGDYLTSPAINPMLMDGSTEGVRNNWNQYTFPRMVPWPWWDTYDPTDFRLCSEQVHNGSGNFLFFDGHAENHLAPKISDLAEYLGYYQDLWDWRGDG